jgi:hypothetical protein
MSLRDIDNALATVDPRYVPDCIPTMSTRFLLAMETYGEKARRLNLRTCNQCGEKMRTDEPLCERCFREVMDGK